MMMRFESLAGLHAACMAMQLGDEAAAMEVCLRQAKLTKPHGSLGRLESLVGWLARWQHKPMPRLDRVEVLVFAGNHGVAARGVSAFPAEVTAQMVANFANGGAAINQLAALAGATLRVIDLDLDNPTADFTIGAALDDHAFLEAASVGAASVGDDVDLLCLGEMGIANTTPAAAISAALFGGGVARWVGRGTGVDDAGLARKRAVVEAGLARHADRATSPLALAAALGGRELAAILGATVAARHKRIPVVLDGFVCTAAVAPLHRLSPSALDHTVASHLSAEGGHRMLLQELGLPPLLDLGMRLGEASGAALAVHILRAAVACHAGMATFGDAGVSNRG